MKKAEKMSYHLSFFKSPVMNTEKVCLYKCESIRIDRNLWINHQITCNLRLS